ncbi:DUF1684 domain-containing protein [Spirosoma aerophilum]
MLKNKYFLVGILLVLTALLYFTFSGGDGTATNNGLEETVDPNAYSQQLTEKRKEKDEFMRTSADSPITEKGSFTGLAYFSPDPAFRVVARLEPFADKTQKLVVRMSDGSEEVYEKFAHAVFSLNGEAHRLLVVKLENTYSILFRDATAGKDTYGGGRYIEIDPKQLTDTQAIIDFNTAYNPYCAYNPTYACPLPPAENKLPFAVTAGEKYTAHP